MRLSPFMIRENSRKALTVGRSRWRRLLARICPGRCWPAQRRRRLIRSRSSCCAIYRSRALSRFRRTGWQSPINPISAKKISQADLAAIATGITDAYRSVGFHLSRALCRRRRSNTGRSAFKLSKEASRQLKRREKALNNSEFVRCSCRSLPNDRRAYRHWSDSCS